MLRVSQSWRTTWTSNMRRDLHVQKALPKKTPQSLCKWLNSVVFREFSEPQAIQLPWVTVQDQQMVSNDHLNAEKEGELCDSVMWNTVFPAVGCRTEFILLQQCYIQFQLNALKSPIFKCYSYCMTNSSFTKGASWDKKTTKWVIPFNTKKFPRKQVSAEGNDVSHNTRKQTI